MIWDVPKNRDKSFFKQVYQLAFSYLIQESSFIANDFLKIGNAFRGSNIILVPKLWIFERASISPLAFFKLQKYPAFNRVNTHFSTLTLGLAGGHKFSFLEIESRAGQMGSTLFIKGLQNCRISRHDSKLLILYSAVL